MNDCKVTISALVAVLILNLIGTFIGFVCLLILTQEDVGLYEIESSRKNGLLGGLAAVFLSSCLFFCCQYDVAPSVAQFTGWCPSLFSLNMVLCFYVIIDLLLLSFLIWNTGGATLSIYTPFLFCILPVVMVAGGSFGVKWLSLVGIIVSFVFHTIYTSSKSAIVIGNARWTYKICYLVITLICVVFPAIARVLRTS